MIQKKNNYLLILHFKDKPIVIGKSTILIIKDMIKMKIEEEIHKEKEVTIKIMKMNYKEIKNMG